MQFVTELYRQLLTGRDRSLSLFTFQLRDGEPAVHVVRGTHPADYYSGGPNAPPNTADQYYKVVAEIPPQIGVPGKHMIVVFTETYDAGPFRFEWPGNIARGSPYSSMGGVGVFSAWILRDEFAATTIAAQRAMFFDTTPIKGRTALGNGKINSPRFEFIEDGFGGVAHELGHAFGLLHDCRDKDHNDHDIMCNGFRNIRWNFADPPQPEKGGRFSGDNMRLLFSSRYLSSDVIRTDNVPPDVQLRVVRSAPNREGLSVTVALDAADDGGLRAVTFYSANDDSVVAGRWLNGKHQLFEQTLQVKRPKSGDLKIEVLVADQGGNIKRAAATAPPP
jgi:hypothetical protein